MFDVEALEDEVFDEEALDGAPPPLVAPPAVLALLPAPEPASELAPELVPEPASEPPPAPDVAAPASLLADFAPEPESVL